MLNLTQESKIKGFIADEIMSGAVKLVLENTFKKKRNDEVGTLASQMMAINLLDEGFKELEKYNNKVKREKKDISNPGF